VRAGKRDRRIRFVTLTATGAQDPETGAEVKAWVRGATVWAYVEDLVPSRNEGQVQNLPLERNPTRVQYLFRTDVDPKMRVELLSRHGAVERTMEIIGGPGNVVRYGRDRVQEILCETITT
jgi:head-tail adaptor